MNLQQHTLTYAFCGTCTGSFSQYLPYGCANSLGHYGSSGLTLIPTPLYLPCKTRTCHMPLWHAKGSTYSNHAFYLPHSFHFYNSLLPFSSLSFVWRIQVLPTWLPSINKPFCAAQASNGFYPLHTAANFKLPAIAPSPPYLPTYNDHPKQNYLGFLFRFKHIIPMVQQDSWTLLLLTFYY